MDLEQIAPFTSRTVLLGRVLHEVVATVSESVYRRRPRDESEAETVEGEGVLLLSPAPIDAKMTGPGIRYWEFARAISRVAPVTLVIPNDTSLTATDWTIYSHKSGDGEQALLDLVTQHQVVVLQGFALVAHATLARHIVEQNKYLVVDLYGPIGLEGLEARAGDLSERAVIANIWDWAALNEQVKLADFCICGCERQRDFLLGMLGANYRLNPHTYAGDHAARRLIDVVPFGLPAEPPIHRHPVLKGVHPQVGPNDRVILWLGGIWNWLDPLSVLRALADVATERQDVKLFFLSGQRAYSRVSAAMTEKAIDLSRSLGLLDRHVFFIDWVPYEERVNYLLEADIGICFHSDVLETRFAFRTRILDYIWARLPTIAGSGETMGDLVQARGLGYAVAPGDVAGLAAAMRSLLNEPDPRGSRRRAFIQAAHELNWDRCTAPLQAYCQAPWRASDKLVSAYDQWSATTLERSLIRAAIAYERLGYYERLSQQLMNGRVMRLLAGAQRVWRRLRKRGRA